MGQTRVDLVHLLEDLRDAYPGPLEETILTEIVANSLDPGARRISLVAEPTERTLLVVDDGSGMARRELARYHDIAATTKKRGEGIGFAGVGIKLGLLVAEEVLTETRRGEARVATRWHLASRHRAPWKWTAPPVWVAQRGTAVALRLRNPLSPLLDPGYVETHLARHFEPFLARAFEQVLGEHYPGGVSFVVNGRPMPPRNERGEERVPVLIRLPRKRKPAAVGYLERAAHPLPEDRRGIAVSTLGKVIKRGWDWLGLTPGTGDRVAGLVEAPGLSVALTLNKGDFVRTGRRGITYLAYRKAIQEAVSTQLQAWGDAPDREDSARRRAARPLERDLEAVLVDLADDFPALSALVERRPGGQRRLPAGTRGDASVLAASVPSPALERVESEEERAVPLDGEGGPRPLPPAAAAEPAAEATLEPPARGGPKRPARYGLGIDFEERPDSGDLGRLIDSTVWVNASHPAYVRAVASRAEGYHVALSVGMALAALAVEPAKSQEFLSAFLGRWGQALGRDRRRRRGRPGR